MKKVITGMRKTPLTTKLFIIALLLSTGICWGSDLTITAQDIGNGQVQIGYTTSGGYLPKGIALNLSLSDGATKKAMQMS